MGTNIRDERKKKEHRFGELCNGDFFEYHGDILVAMPTLAETERVNSYNFGFRTAEYVDDDEIVEKLDVDIIINDKR